MRDVVVPGSQLPYNVECKKQITFFGIRQAVTQTIYFAMARATNP